MLHPGGGAAVLDPFCGSGTTLVEAQEADLVSVGIDLSPLAALIARVKTTPCTANVEAEANAVCQAAQRRLQAGEVSIPAIPNLDHWFLPPVQQALAALVAEINSRPRPEVIDVLKVVLSSIVVRVSNQDSDTRYAAVAKGITQSDVWEHFRRAASSTNLMLHNSGPHLFTRKPMAYVINKDLMAVCPQDIPEPIGLVVTSPPYPNAYEYWLYHKYRMFWLGMDPIAVREKEIGARAHYFRKNHQTEHDFQRQMGHCFWLLSQAMLPGTYACFVVGRSVIHGREIDNQALLQRAAAPHGFTLAGAVEREIAPNRKSFNLSHAKIRREGVVVFQLESSDLRC